MYIYNILFSAKIGRLIGGVWSRNVHVTYGVLFEINLRPYRRIQACPNFLIRYSHIENDPAPAKARMTYLEAYQDEMELLQHFRSIKMYHRLIVHVQNVAGSWRAEQELALEELPLME